MTETWLMSTKYFSAGDIVRVRHTDLYGVVIKLRSETLTANILALIIDRTSEGFERPHLSWWPTFSLEVVSSRHQ